MIRNDIKQLSSWLTSPHRKPLIIRGARQVGKSTLVRNFALEKKLNLVEINMEQYPLLNDIFKTNQANLIMNEIMATSPSGIAINQPQNALLFIDEIQATPHAISALRYLAEVYPQLPIIAAGSLLEFVLSNHSFSMPVGRVEYLHLGPMKFSEFLLAVGDDDLHKIISQWNINVTIPSTAHNRLLQRQREYLFVGGMPEAISLFIKNNSFNDARKTHRIIMQSYQDDFAKYAHNQTLNRLHRVLNAIPRINGQKTKYVNISREDRASEIKTAIDLLIKARLLLPAYHSDCSGLPIKAGIDENKYKLYFLDCGLFSYLCGLDWLSISHLDERHLINEGVLAEQFIAQHLAYRENGLEPPENYYWLRENRSSNAKIDFVISEENQIKPIEVKAGKSGSLKSLLQFAAEKKTKHAYRFDLNLPSTQKVNHALPNITQKQKTNFTLTSLPLYLVEQLQKSI